MTLQAILIVQFDPVVPKILLFVLKEPPLVNLVGYFRNPERNRHVYLICINTS